jgi:signal transduction histidine kinase
MAFGLLLTVLAGIIFASRSGWPAYALGAILLLSAHATPHVLFQSGIVFPYLMPAAAAWLSVSAAASYQHFVVRRQLRASETEKTRYQQAIRFVTHEMRTPLTAIQGSSELMGRYNLSEDKRRDMARMIHSESKRLGRMIQTFLDVERLSEGQMQLRREPVDAGDVVRICIDRVAPLAEGKQIQISSQPVPDTIIEGDRELMEYAVYNLLTNAVKYSPAETSITVSGVREGGNLRISVRDQGFGMDEKELRDIFRKFYRTRKAEASGEPGTGIGLSIVEQILASHGGSIEVTSSPGHGSCFTMVLPSPAPIPRPK